MIDKFIDENKNLIIFILLILCYMVVTYVGGKYPYYFQFDTDATVAIDTLLINSHELPDHVQHPSYGMYIFLSGVSRIAQFLNIIPITNLSGLEDCMHKSTCMADYSSFLRALSPIIAILTAFFLFLSLWVFDNKNKLLLIIALAFFLLEETLFYNALVIKSELYSLFFWSISLFLSSFLWRFNKIPIVILVGLFAGLLFTTKVQFIFYFGFTYLYVMYISLNTESLISYSRKQLLITNSLASILLMWLMAAAWKMQLEVGFSNLWSVSGLNIVGVALLVMMLTLFVLTFFLSSKIKNYKLVNGIVWLSYLNFGFVSSLYIGLTFSKGFMLQAMKMMFFRQFQDGVGGKIFFGGFGDFSPYLMSRFSIYAVLVAVICAFMVYMLKKQSSLTSKYKLNLNIVFIGLALLMVILNYSITVRPLLRDLFIAKFLLIYLSLYLIIAYHKFIGEVIPYKYILTLLLSLLFLNSKHTLDIDNNLNAQNTHYGYRDNNWITGVYDVNHRIYTKVFSRQQDWNHDKILARDFNKNKKLLRSIFINSKISTRNINYLKHYELFRSKEKGLHQKLAKNYPSYLHGSLVYTPDLNSFSKQKLRGSWEVNYPYVTYMFDYEVPREGIKMEVLPRADYKIFLYTKNVLESNFDDYQKGTGTNEQYKELMKNYNKVNNDPAVQIVMHSGDVYSPVLLNSYTVLDKEILENSFFVIIN